MKTDAKTLLKKLLTASEDVSGVLEDIEIEGDISFEVGEDRKRERLTEAILETRAFLGMIEGDGE